MKKLVVVMAVLFSVTGFSQVNEKVDKKQDVKRTEKRSKEGKENRFLEDFKDLDLSEKQQNELKAIFEAERNSMKQNRFRSKNDGESKRPSESEMKEMREKMKERREALDGRVKNILSEEQYGKWKEKKEAKMKVFSERQRPNKSES